MQIAFSTHLPPLLCGQAPSSLQIPGPLESSWTRKEGIKGPQVPGERYEQTSSSVCKLVRGQMGGKDDLLTRQRSVMVQLTFPFSHSSIFFIIC